MNLECKRNYGEIVSKIEGSIKYYLDQISDNDNIWIPAYSWGKYLQYTYGINFPNYQIICNAKSNNIKPPVIIDRVSVDNNSPIKDKGKLIIKRIYDSNGIYIGFLRLDQLNINEDDWIDPRGFNAHIRIKYGLLDYQYYNLVIHGDLNYIHKCINCDKELDLSRFVNLSHGWMSYCCRKCQLSDKAKKQHADPNSLLNKSLSKWNNSDRAKQLKSKLFHDMNVESWSKPEYRKFMSEHTDRSINSWYGKIKNKRTAFIRQGKPEDTCKIYVGITKDLKSIKFGVTGVNLDKGRCNRKWRLDLFTIHKVNEGDRISMAEFEANIKFKLQSDKEFYPIEKLRDIINIIKELKRN